MRVIVSFLLAGVLALASIGVSTQPAEAGWKNGVFSFGGRTATMTRTFYDRTPRRTPVVLALQKKAGSGKCRARVIVKSGGFVSRSQWIYKYSRTRSRGYGTVINWPNRVKRTTVTVRTNGRCIYGVAAS